MLTPIAQYRLGFAISGYRSKKAWSTLRKSNNGNISATYHKLITEARCDPNDWIARAANLKGIKRVADFQT
jgi:hypothetical protein